VTKINPIAAFLVFAIKRDKDGEFRLLKSIREGFLSLIRQYVNPLG
jgi:hypothetical protein